MTSWTATDTLSLKSCRKLCLFDEKTGQNKSSSLFLCFTFSLLMELSATLFFPVIFDTVWCLNCDFIQWGCEIDLNVWSNKTNVCIVFVKKVHGISVLWWIQVSEHQYFCKSRICEFKKTKKCHESGSACPCYLLGGAAPAGYYSTQLFPPNYCDISPIWKGHI